MNDHYIFLCLKFSLFKKFYLFQILKDIPSIISKGGMEFVDGKKRLVFLFSMSLDLFSCYK